MEIRHITDAEKRAYFQLRRYCFGDWTEREAGTEELRRHMPEESFALWDGGKLMAGMVIRRFRQVVRGAVKPMGGIANVSSYPEGRNRGYVKKLFDVCFRDMKDTGRPVSMLHPFRESYYERFGYATASNPLRITVPTSALLHHLHGGGSVDVERRTGQSARADLTEWVAGPGPAPNGYVLPDPVSTDYWEWRFADELILTARSAGWIVGGACYTLRSTEPAPQLRVRDLHWSTLEGRDALLRFLTLHRDQVSHVQLTVPFEAPLLSWLRDTMTGLELGMDPKPWMVRVVDVIPALSGLRTAEGRLTLGVDDPWCEWNNGSYLLEAADGRLRVAPTDAKPEASVTIQGLSALAYGTLDAAELAHRGWLQTEDPGRVDQLFPRRTFFNSTPF